MGFLSKPKPPEQDMLFSKGDLKHLLIPLLLEQLLAVTIGMMDTVMVASCGEAAVSGVSLVDSINVLLINMFSALATGGAVVTSQYLGKQDKKNAGTAAKQLIYVILLVSAAVMGLCLVFRDIMLDGIFGHIDADVMENARIYFAYSALSYPFLALYNASAALLRSMGNAKASLETSLVMNVINVVGNAVLIFGFHMGVAGAAIATLISRAAGALLMQITLKSPACTIPYPVLHQFEWHGDMVKKILKVGVPNGLENSMFQMGKLILLQLVSTFGTVSIAANAVGNTLSTFQVIPGNAMSLVMITVVGRCVGAKRFDQARYYVRQMMRQCYIYMGLLNIAMLLCNGFITKPFNLSPETELLARQIVAIHGAGCIIIWPMSFVLPNALRAAGDARFTMVISTVSMITFRIVFGFLLAKTVGLGVVGVWIAMQIDWVFRVTCFLIRFHGKRWEAKALV